jgi:cellulose synthase/poly-beta-1,6-N-acetylglucosamine synthase-like glycosyltransferase
MYPPLISIVIPVRNEAGFIERCLESVYAQDLGGLECEVIAADGMSDDGTSEKLKTLKSRYPNLKILENPKRTVSSGVNLGIRESKGDVIVRLDAHAEYGADYVKNCLEALERTGAGNVGGPAIPLPGGGTDMARAIVLAHYSPFGLGGGSFRKTGAEGFAETLWPGCFLREALEKSGLYDERLTRTEDIELNARIRKAGYRVYLSSRIRAFYYCRPNLKELWRQRWLDGIGVVQTLAVNPGAPRPRHFVPLAFVSSMILLAALSIPLTPFRWMLAAEAGLYLGAMAWFTLGGLTSLRAARERERERGGADVKTWNPGLLRLLPPAFAALHFSYGLGSLWAVLSAPAWWARFRKPMSFELENA